MIELLFCIAPFVTGFIIGYFLVKHGDKAHDKKWRVAVKYMADNKIDRRFLS